MLRNAPLQVVEPGGHQPKNWRLYFVINERANLERDWVIESTEPDVSQYNNVGPRVPTDLFTHESCESRSLIVGWVARQFTYKISSIRFLHFECQHAGNENSDFSIRFPACDAHLCASVHAPVRC